MNAADSEQTELQALLGTQNHKSSKEQIKSQAILLQEQLTNLPKTTSELGKASMMLDLGGLLVALENKESDENSWQFARNAFEIFLKHEAWGEAVKSCDILFEADQPASVVALANGTWLAVTYPVEPELTIRMLEHIVDDTPEKSDGAAVAAIVAHYIADSRCDDEKKHNSLTFMTRNLVATVAQRHSKVKSQQEMDAWLDRMSLRDPQQFIPRLARVLDLMAMEQWWYERDALRAKLPQ